VEVSYRLYLKYYSTSDVGNFEKLLTDIIVKAGMIDDDRFIKKMVLEKFKSDNDYIEIEIKKY
jgi:Holliday junction resolvase RusA-like endonuclease